MYKNIMLKISGESLAGDNEQGIDFNILNDLSNNIKKLADKKIRISIVLGGGNFIRGSSFSKFMMYFSTIFSFSSACFLSNTSSMRIFPISIISFFDREISLSFREFNFYLLLT